MVGEVVLMGDFNEFRNKAKRVGSIFHVHGALLLMSPFQIIIFFIFCLVGIFLHSLICREKNDQIRLISHFRGFSRNISLYFELCFGKTYFRSSSYSLKGNGFRLWSFCFLLASLVVFLSDFDKVVHHAWENDGVRDDNAIISFLKETSIS